MKEIKYLFFIIIISHFPILIGCTSLQDTTPNWISITPERNENVEFFVGGPSTDIAESKEMALSEISHTISTAVSAISSSYTYASYEDINESINEKMLSTFDNSSEAISFTVFSGVKIIERWYDPNNDEWWVLASVCQSDLLKGIDETAEQIEKNAEEKLQFSNQVKQLVESITESESKSGFFDLLLRYIEVYNLFPSSQYRDHIYAEIDGQYLNIFSFIKTKINQLLASNTITAEPQNTILMKNNNKTIILSREPNKDHLGKLRMVVENGTKEIIYSDLWDLTQPICDLKISSEKLPMGESLLHIYPDYTSVGIMIPEEMVIPVLNIPITIIDQIPSVEFDLSKSILIENVSEHLEALLTDKSVDYIISDEESFPKIVISLNQEEGSKLGAMQAVRTEIVISYEAEKGESYVFISAPVKGYGSSLREAAKDSFQKALAETQMNPQCGAFIESYITK